jgi:hypothetical protein
MCRVYQVSPAGCTLSRLSDMSNCLSCGRQHVVSLSCYNYLVANSCLIS